MIKFKIQKMIRYILYAQTVDMTEHITGKLRRDLGMKVQPNSLSVLNAAMSGDYILRN